MRMIEIPSDKLKTVDAGSAAILQWVRIDQLVIDDDYQRELQRQNWSAIRRIAASFKWSRFSPVFVAPVEGGRFAIIDGQHRTHAAAMCGFVEVPCQIVQMTKQEQAASFAAVNGLVTRVTPWNIFKAASAAGEIWAVASTQACADAGCRLMDRNATTSDKKPGEVFCVKLIKGYVDAGHAAMVTHALRGLRKSEFGKSAEAYTAEILKPFLSALSERPWLRKANVDLADFLDEFDIYTAIDRAGEFVKRKRREGFADVSRFDIVSIEIGEALDKAHPQRIALPAPRAA
ncbi:hypothetical protein ASG43_12190 [Aureimonas sp. Leaf454]|uniref:ParB/RepB/Spo0J family partition protein n=1 Tax=Aureimonas sp. Leaf454 TaxID=1736381 RepID=UPI0006F56F31|nr:ParB/RepB/Spo0J family partition protein [Aureimonas sp. Leaf454]KQT45065.1 hypothetical protein ASG43_12190 [Aureimonas sp. Leaf454]